jgi:hypothetical protein
MRFTKGGHTKQRAKRAHSLKSQKTASPLTSGPLASTTNFSFWRVLTPSPMSGRPRIDSISNYDDFWLSSAARNATGGDVDLPNVDGNVAAVKLDPATVGIGDGQLDVGGGNGGTRRPTIRADSLSDDKMVKLTPNLTPSLMAHTYFNDISPLSKPLIPSGAHAEGQ